LSTFKKIAVTSAFDGMFVQKVSRTARVLW